MPAYVVELAAVAVFVSVLLTLFLICLARPRRLSVVTAIALGAQLAAFSLLLVGLRTGPLLAGKIVSPERGASHRAQLVVSAPTLSGAVERHFTVRSDEIYQPEGIDRPAVMRGAVWPFADQLGSDPGAPLVEVLLALGVALTALLLALAVFIRSAARRRAIVTPSAA